MAGNWVSYRSSIVAVAGRAFLLQSEFTVIRLTKESLSGKLFKISIFATSLKWKKCFQSGRLFFLMVDDMDIGYVGKSNKQLIKIGQDVDDAYTSRFDHKYEELVIYIEEKRENARVRNKNYRLTGMVDGLFSFTSIVILFLLLFMLISSFN